MAIKPDWTVNFNQVPGVPANGDRMLTPMVNINGTVQMMPPGEKIPHQFLPAQLAGGLTAAQAVQAVVDTNTIGPAPAAIDLPNIPTIHYGTNSAYLGEPDAWVRITTPIGVFVVAAYVELPQI